MSSDSGFGRVVVLLGGNSSEREISLLSGRGVLAALRAQGIAAEPFDPGRSGVAELLALAPDRAFIALHGRGGEDGCVQGLLECLGVPYTGSGVLASARAIDKWMTRLLWAEAGLPVARGALVTDPAEAPGVIARLGGELVVKPNGEGSSIGVVKLSGACPEELAEALRRALALDPRTLVEERVYGRELTVALLDGRALPIVEIVAPEGDYDYHNKYFGAAVRYHCPADLPEELAARLRADCEKAFAVLGARGWGRLDLLLRPDGSYVLLELNTSPGMTEHSLVPMAAQAAGLSYQALVRRVLELAALDGGWAAPAR